MFDLAYEFELRWNLYVYMYGMLVARTAALGRLRGLSFGAKKRPTTGLRLTEAPGSQHECCVNNNRSDLLSKIPVEKSTEQRCVLFTVGSEQILTADDAAVAALIEPTGGCSGNYSGVMSSPVILGWFVSPFRSEPRTVTKQDPDATFEYRIDRAETEQRYQPSYEIRGYSISEVATHEKCAGVNPSLTAVLISSSAKYQGNRDSRADALLPVRSVLLPATKIWHGDATRYLRGTGPVG